MRPMKKSAGQPAYWSTVLVDDPPEAGAGARGQRERANPAGLDPVRHRRRSGAEAA